MTIPHLASGLKPVNAATVSQNQADAIGRLCAFRRLKAERAFPNATIRSEFRRYSCNAATLAKRSRFRKR
jgi:hypothetical protein